MPNSKSQTARRIPLWPPAGIGFVPRMLWLIIRLFLGAFYRVRLEGAENIPATGGALLVANHLSWMDGFFVLIASRRVPRMVVYSGNFNHPVLQWLARQARVIMIASGPKGIARGLIEARQALLAGDVVGIFPEGGISRNGQLQSFRPGLLKILEKTEAPVIPVYLAGVWGSIFSFEGKRFFLKRPKRIPYPVTLHYGPPLTSVTDIYPVRQVVQQMEARIARNETRPLRSLPSAMLRMCKRRKFQSKVADSSGTDLKGADLLLRALILRRLMRRHVLSANESHIGVLLPPSVGGVLANLALALDRRISANLNYTMPSEVLNVCLERAGIRHILTSRRFMSKMNFSLNAELVYLEDFRDKPTWHDKLWCALAAYAIPSWILERMLGLQKIAPDDVATVIFTSGSTGEPKGVMLTHKNVASNVEAVDRAIHLRPTDVVVGILPFFHSFGLTVTLWAPCTLNIKGIYHFSPLDAKQIGALIKEHQATILLSTPTFLRTYLKRCDAEQLKTLDVVVAGAEKLPSSLCQAFEEKCGVRPVEGYGATELSPLVSVNIPASRSSSDLQVTRKEGTVGRPVPGVAAKVVDPESGRELGPDQSGMLWITGPNVMKGYLGQSDKTADVIRDGWYMTGDLATIDVDGFITITGRESRFSKIGGEMVPHLQIEEALANLLGTDEEHAISVAVTAVPDERKGERLVVLLTPSDSHKSPDQLCHELSQMGLPNLYIPSPDSFVEVDRIPILGTGKLDLKRMRTIAEEKFRAVPASDQNRPPAGHNE